MTTQMINWITLLRNLKIILFKIKNSLLPSIHGTSHVKEKRKIIDSENLRSQKMRN